MTRALHQMEVNPSPGPHTLTLVDDRGEVLSRSFHVESR
jgi:hypothetical protein